MFYADKAEELNEWFTKWVAKMPGDKKESIIELMDHMFFYLSSFFQQKEQTEELERKILLEARLFDPEIHSIHQMDQLALHQLEYLEEKWKRKYTMYALIEGGIAGIGHPFFLVADLPALLAINMKMIQAIASSYGYSLKSPAEQVILLQVLHAASLHEKMHGSAMEWLEENFLDEEDALLAYRQDTVLQPEWLETLVKQWMKSLVLYGMKKTTKNSFSILGVALGANLNYQFSKRVAQFSSEFYRKRFLHEMKRRKENEH